MPDGRAVAYQGDVRDAAALTRAAAEFVAHFGPPDVVIASVAGFRGLPGAGAYSASKAAAITYLESLRVELARSGIAVVTICPGYVATPMTAANPYPMPFLMKAERAASLIARAIARRRRFCVRPWPTAIVGWLLKRLPRPLYDFAFVHAPRKPRRPI